MTTRTVIVLGMHRSRTSLVSHICSVLGVHMGDRMLGTHPSQPHGHWEDVDFYELNQHIIHALGGKWDKPPTVEQVCQTAKLFSNQAAGLIARKSCRPLWGWKDPRTCLTLPVYWPFLKDPRIVLVTRNMGDVIRSLMARSGGNPDKWRPVVDLYYEGMAWISCKQPVPVIEINTDLLVSDRFGARMQVRILSEFVEGNGKIDGAMRVIEFK